jgi:gas vesicle protein
MENNSEQAIKYILENMEIENNQMLRFEKLCKKHLTKEHMDAIMSYIDNNGFHKSKELSNIFHQATKRLKRAVGKYSWEERLEKESERRLLE